MYKCKVRTLHTPRPVPASHTGWSSVLRGGGSLERGPPAVIGLQLAFARHEQPARSIIISGRGWWACSHLSLQSVWDHLDVDLIGEDKVLDLVQQHGVWGGSPHTLTQPFELSAASYLEVDRVPEGSLREVTWTWHSHDTHMTLTWGIRNPTSCTFNDESKKKSTTTA